MRTFNKTEAADILDISVRELENRMKSGEVTFSKEPARGPKGYRCMFSCADLGLPEDYLKPEPIPVATVEVIEPVVEPVVESIPALTADEEFARAYLAGEVPDSMGNFHDSTHTVPLVNAPPVEHKAIITSGYGGKDVVYAAPIVTEQNDLMTSVMRDIARGWSR